MPTDIHDYVHTCIHANVNHIIHVCIHDWMDDRNSDVTCGRMAVVVWWMAGVRHTFMMSDGHDHYTATIRYDVDVADT